MPKIDRFLPVLSNEIIPYSESKGDDGRYMDFEFDNAIFNTNNCVELNGCSFSRVSFIGDLSKVRFVDCIFRHCDFSNRDLSHSQFVRVYFDHCKGTGTSFHKSKFKYTTFKSGTFSLSDFSECEFEYIRIIDCNLSESTFQSCNQNYFETRNVDFTQVDFSNTALKQMDLSGCKIQGIRVNSNLLKGLILDAQQTVGLATLLGVIIKE